MVVVHNVYTITAQRVYLLLHNVYTTTAQRVHCYCTTCTGQVHHNHTAYYGGGAQRVYYNAQRVFS